MKVFSLLFVFLLGWNAKSTHSLTIYFDNKDDNKGNIMIAIYSDSSTFLVDGKEFQTAIISAKEKKYTFSNLPHDTYAIAIYQDVNNNRKLDKNWFGVPQERYGFSNNAMGTLGPPTFTQSKIMMTTNTVTRIKLR